MPLLNTGSGVHRRRRRRSELAGRTIGVLAPAERQGPFLRLLLDALRTVLGRAEAQMTIVPPAIAAAESPADGLRDLGISTALCIGPFPAGIPFDPRRIPAVLLNQDAGALDIDAVRQDNEFGGYLMLRHLFEQGFRDVAVVTGPGTHPSANGRLQGAIRACRETEHGDPRIVVVGGFTAAGGAEATRTILQARRLPQAVFYMNDEMALAGQEVLADTAATIHLAIAGYDDIPDAAVHGLTTVQAPVRDMAAAAAELLERRLSSPARAFQSIKLRPRLVARASTVRD